ncbi:MAG: hypothetical protein HY548_05555 [Elusimicrobia bacterium]|nr:hypothetical protein [Elusimicrobiota bacterium]
MSRLFEGQNFTFTVPRSAIESLTAALRQELARELKAVHYLDRAEQEEKWERAAAVLLDTQARGLWQTRRSDLMDLLERLDSSGEPVVSKIEMILGIIDRMGRKDGQEAALRDRSPETMPSESVAVFQRLAAFWEAAASRPLPAEILREWQSLYQEAHQQGMNSVIVKDGAPLWEAAARGEDWSVSLFDMSAGHGDLRNPEQRRALAQLAGQLSAIRSAHSSGRASNVLLPVFVDDYSRPGKDLQESVVEKISEDLRSQGRFYEESQLREMAESGRLRVVTAKDLSLEPGRRLSPGDMLLHIQKTYLQNQKIGLFQIFTLDARRWKEEWRSAIRFQLNVILSETKVMEVMSGVEQSLKTLELMRQNA